jgi:hypothetical protein
MATLTPQKLHAIHQQTPLLLVRGFLHHARMKQTRLHSRSDRDRPEIKKFRDMSKVFKNRIFGSNNSQL